MSTQVCPRCGSANPASQPYCGQCGAPLSNTELLPYMERVRVERERAERALVPIAPRVPATRLPAARLPAALARAVPPAVALSALGLGLRLLQAWLQRRERRTGAGARAVPSKTTIPVKVKRPAPRQQTRLPARSETRALEPRRQQPAEPAAGQAPAAGVPQRIVVVRRSFQMWVTTIWRE